MLPPLITLTKHKQQPLTLHSYVARRKASEGRFLQPGDRSYARKWRLPLRLLLLKQARAGLKIALPPSLRGLELFGMPVLQVVQVGDAKSAADLF